jgi:hypothetical protein
MSVPGPSVWTGRALQAESDDLEGWSCASVSGLLLEPLSSWPSWISARVRSHSRLGPEGQKGHLITNALARPFSISSFRLADLGGKATSTIVLGGQLERQSFPSVNLSVSGCRLREARLITALLGQHRPGDPCQLVGESCGQNVGMEALSGAREPDPEAVLRPACRP